jgi:hypothetical protein
VELGLPQLAPQRGHRSWEIDVTSKAVARGFTRHLEERGGGPLARTETRAAEPRRGAIERGTALRTEV